MNLGNSLIIYLFLLIAIAFPVQSEDRISTSPLINLNQIEPRFENIIEKNESSTNQKKIRERKKKSSLSSSHAILIGLDNITAKSSEIVINIDEVKKFGPFEIKILKCGKVKVNNKLDDVAYMQVKDMTKNDNEKVFIFNGWTFASDPSLAPFDHAIYDLQLLNCQNV